VNVEAERGVANQIAPGDHVDIATSTTDETGLETTTYLLRNVKVLAVGSTPVQAGGPSALGEAASNAVAPAPTQGSGLLTFEVSSDDALRVISANNGASKMYLVLLPPKLGGSGGTSSATGSR
jgi:Flp pilus assembly protein CpaB